jgi:hypothetical protein
VKNIVHIVTDMVGYQLINEKKELQDFSPNDVINVMGPENMQPSKCFWCEDILTNLTGTNDHLISRPLRIPNIPNKIVRACRECNRKRATISGLFVNISNNTIKYKISVSNTIIELMEDIKNFEQKIISLESPIREICLFEITTVNQFAFKNRPHIKRDPNGTTRKMSNLSK